MRKEDIIIEVTNSQEIVGTILLFHGLTSTPDEMLDVANYFNTKGFRIVLPCLSGHGTRIEDLKVVREQEWLDDADRAFAEASKVQTPALFTIGQSFGALLSLYVTTKYSERIAGTGLLSPPILFSSFRRELLLRLLSLLPDELLNSLGVVPKKHRENPGFIRPREAYTSHSVASAVRLFKIRRLVLAALSKVSNQIFVLQDPDDHHISVDVPNVLRRAARLSTIEHRWIVGGRHELSIGPRQEVVLTELERFLQQTISNEKGSNEKV